MTYAEKADIAAKAVKVLDSVTMTRQIRAGERYAKLAKERVKYFAIVGGIASIPVAEDLVRKIEKSLEGMKRRLDKPRYTLKDGEWVRKWPDECRGVGLKAGSGRDHYQMTVAMKRRERRNRLAQYRGDTDTVLPGQGSGFGNAPLGSICSDEYRGAQRLRNLRMAVRAERMAGVQNVGSFGRL